MEVVVAAAAAEAAAVAVAVISNSNSNSNRNSKGNSNSNCKSNSSSSRSSRSSSCSSSCSSSSSSSSRSNSSSRTGVGPEDGRKNTRVVAGVAAGRGNINKSGGKGDADMLRDKTTKKQKRDVDMSPAKTRSSNRTKAAGVAAGGGF